MRKGLFLLVLGVVFGVLKGQTVTYNLKLPQTDSILLHLEFPSDSALLPSYDSWKIRVWFDLPENSKNDIQAIALRPAKLLKREMEGAPRIIKSLPDLRIKPGETLEIDISILENHIRSGDIGYLHIPQVYWINQNLVFRRKVLPVNQAYFKFRRNFH